MNELYPVGKLYCEFCQSKHKREIIKKLAKDFAMLCANCQREVGEE